MPSRRSGGTYKAPEKVDVYPLPANIGENHAIQTFTISSDAAQGSVVGQLDQVGADFYRREGAAPFSIDADGEITFDANDARAELANVDADHDVLFRFSVRHGMHDVSADQQFRTHVRVTVVVPE
jgi:hypothetical protein